jgi:hypothetical protein
LPTATQALADVHEIPVSTVDVVPLGFGVLSMVQAVPFQASAEDTVLFGAVA